MLRDVNSRSVHRVTPENLAQVWTVLSVRSSRTNSRSMAPPPALHSGNRGTNFGPFSYSSDTNVPFHGRNKRSRLIFIAAKIKEVINFGSSHQFRRWALGAHIREDAISHVLNMATSFKNCNGHNTCFWIVSSRSNILQWLKAIWPEELSP